MILQRTKRPTDYLGEIVFHCKVSILQLRRSFQNLRKSGVRKYSPNTQSPNIPNVVLAESITPLWGSHDIQEWNLVTGKIENLRVALRQINGVELPPQAVFSFWAQLGKPTRRNGFVKGRELRQGCIIPSVGGGLCQLSNSLYCAALDAKLEIIERHGHTQVIPGSLAEIGRDATVFWNYVDLRFRTSVFLRIEAFLTTNSLVIRFLGTSPQERVPSLSNTVERAIIKHTKSCQTCGVSSCFRSKPVAVDKLIQKVVSAYLVDEYWPEFDQYIQETRQSQDILMLPMDGAHWSKPNYAWTIKGFAGVEQSIFFTLERAIACRRISPQGRSRQELLLKFDQKLAKQYGKRLQPEVTHIVVMQNLLPFLWQSGYLGGRTFDVLMTRLPIDKLQSRLDIAAQRYPESYTLKDFRCDPALIEAENQALNTARKIITPHTEYSNLFPEKTILLNWNIPIRTSPPNQGNLILFPSSTLGRKGAYELRHVAKELDLNLRILGNNLEDSEFWLGVSVQYALVNPFDQVKIVVLPAYVENCPRILLKAVALGIPVIASEACGLNGMADITTIPNGSAEALSTAIQSFLMSN